MECSWITDDTKCASAGAAAHWPIALCEEHRLEFDHRLSLAKGTASRQSARVLGSDSYPGLCYIVLLGNGLVKIGYSNTDLTLNHRLNKLRKETGSCEVLRVLTGGFISEACLHDRFSKHRVWSEQECFQPDPEILAFAASQDPAQAPVESWASKALARTCPVCGALPGVRCESNVSGHKERRELVRET